MYIKQNKTEPVTLNGGMPTYPNGFYFIRFYMQFFRLLCPPKNGIHQTEIDRQNDGTENEAP